MGQRSGPVKQPAEQVVKEIRRATRRQFSAEEKIRIVLTGLRGEDSIAELCRREGIVQNLYYRWSKEFLEAGKKRLAFFRRCVLEDPEITNEELHTKLAAAGFGEVKRALFRRQDLTLYWWLKLPRNWG